MLRSGVVRYSGESESVMACSTCDTNFHTHQTLVLSLRRTAGSMLLYAQNQGRNIVLIRRILLCYTLPDSTGGMLYLRPPPAGMSWVYPSEFLEQGLTALYYQLTVPKGTFVEAQAEYVEVDGRSKSCAEQL